MSMLDTLAAEVAANRSVVDSVKTLLAGMAQQLKDAQGDPTRMSQLISDLQNQTAELAASVASNTPVDPNAPPAASPSAAKSHRA